LSGKNWDIGHGNIKPPKFMRIDWAQTAKPSKVPWMLFLNQVHLRVNKTSCELYLCCRQAKKEE